ncbi:MAG TPA: cysteine hydrolase [Candidatus Baltobacteraceae bacterium]|nr:cysteine hydrolase [Candidatus Dormibacteraeota bacterium]HVA26662.1 cysteine hydrolase [Candidatus Baltobacteraceae bacterium]
MSEATQRIDAKRAALLVMDFQAGIIGMLENSDALVAKAALAIRSMRDLGGLVGYVRVGFTDTDYAAISERNKGFWAAKSAGRAFHADAPATAIDERLTPQSGDIIVRKTRVGAFSTTDLAEQLRGRGVDTLILSGISTSGVVLSTLRDAADRDFRLFVIADACADPAADVHATLLEKVFPRQADVISSADLHTILS